MASVMPVPLRQLLAGVGGALISGNPDVSITSIEVDSRRVEPGALFVCLVGAREDGHSHVASAVRAGATAVLAAHPVELPSGIPLGIVPDTLAALSAVAAEFFGHPSDALTVIGITGTNGKSTVTSLVASMASAAGRRVLAGGNLGVPALDLLEQPIPDLYVLELSSFQLETTWSLELLGAVVLNVTADHMDRYASVADYARAKSRIFAHAATVVLNADDPLVAGMRAGIRAAAAAARGNRRVVTFSTQRADADYSLVRSGNQTLLGRHGEGVLDLSRMRITGLHNAANALAALALGDAAGLPLAVMQSALAAFPGLPHRSQWVADIAGVRYLDDSKGTNVGATLAAVDGMQGPLVMIAGGAGKGQDFAPLAEAFRDKVRHVILIGKDAPAIERVLMSVCSTERAASMEDAVTAAARAALAGDTVLLSPACASLDMFRDYGHRGDVFAAAVHALAVRS
jgi:UDP-N-acetylmuramoylalanine--D-glutamate ligase